MPACAGLLFGSFGVAVAASQADLLALQPVAYAPLWGSPGAESAPAGPASRSAPAARVWSLLAVEGAGVRVLLPPSAQARLGAAAAQALTDDCDLLLAWLRHTMDAEALGSARISVAFVPTGGLGFAALGGTKVELDPSLLDALLDAAPGEALNTARQRLFTTLTHELVHCLDWHRGAPLSARLCVGREPEHGLTAFLEQYVGEAWNGVAGRDRVRELADERLGPYLAARGDWQSALANPSSAPPWPLGADRFAADAQGGMLLRLAADHGPGFVPRFFAAARSAIDALPQGRGLDAEARLALLVRVACQAADLDLSNCFAAWRCPLSAELRADLALRYPPDPAFADADADGWTVFAGDPDDRDPHRVPASAEMLEYDDLPAQTAAETLAVPALVTGAATRGDADALAVHLDAPAAVRLTLRSLDSFVGWVLVYQPDGISWLMRAFVGAGSQTSATVDLPAGDSLIEIADATEAMPRTADAILASLAPEPDRVAPDAASESAAHGGYTLSLRTATAPAAPAAPRVTALGPAIFVFDAPLPAASSPLGASTGLTARWWLAGVGWIARSAPDAPCIWIAPAGLASEGRVLRMQLWRDDAPAGPISAGTPLPGVATRPGAVN